MAAPPPPPKGGGMSLYANLLNPNADAAASVSGAPVLYDTGERDDSAVKKEVNPALRFQPIRRPQVNQKKAPKPTFPKAIPAPPPSSTNITSTTENKDSVPVSVGTPPHPGVPPAPPPAAPAAPPPPPARSTLADWAATEEDEYLWAAAAEKRQRGGRKAAKKRKKLAAENQRETDWDEIYDPARPTNVEEYLRSEERIREVQEWKTVLYAHRRKGRRDSYEESDESDDDGERTGVGNQFAPPADFSFAPPPMSPPSPPPPPPRDSPSAAAPISTEATGDDAYAQRLAMSGMTATATASSPVPAPLLSPPPPPPPPPPEDGATISRAPVRYEAPTQSTAMDMDDDVEDVDLPPSFGLSADTDVRSGGSMVGEGDGDEDGDGDRDGDGDQPRSSRPGQKGFAQRLMSKYGWTAGSGLGASSSGIINPLSVKVEKRRKRPDAEGGGFAEPGGRGRVVGGRTAGPSTSADGDAGKFGAMSEVIVLRNMLEGMENLQEEISQGLGQEIGEECGDKYGRVERLYIDVEGRQVFIKFTDQVSALRAVNALEGRVFNGNAIAARFWDAEKFERGEYH